MGETLETLSRLLPNLRADESRSDHCREPVIGQRSDHLAGEPISIAGRLSISSLPVGLVSYGSDTVDPSRQAAGYVNPIVKLEAVDKAIAQTIDNDSGLRRKCDLLLSISGVGEALAGVVMAELPGPDVLRSSAEVVAYAGLNPRQHQSGTSIDRVTGISKIGNAVLRAALYLPAMSAMRYNPAIVALVAG